MTGDAVNGRNGCGTRAGTWTLNLLATPLNAPILRALQDGAKTQLDLQHETGHPPQTTLRAQLKKLGRAGMVEKRKRSSFPGVLEYELSAAGRDLLPVIDSLQRWLDQAPEGPSELGSPPGKVVVKALAEGWSTRMLRALAARPLTLTQLDGVISSHNYPSLERRLVSMRLVGVVEACPGEDRGTPYTVSDWARRGMASILAAARWEQRHASAETAPLSRGDIEAAFMLSARLLSFLSTGISASCHLAVELPDREDPSRAGVLLNIDEGRLASCTTRLEGRPDAWVTGSLAAWLTALLDHDLAGLEMEGDLGLARIVIGSLHDGLERVVR